LHFSSREQAPAVLFVIASGFSRREFFRDVYTKAGAKRLAFVLAGCIRRAANELDASNGENGENDRTSLLLLDAGGGGGDDLYIFARRKSDIVFEIIILL